MPAISRFYGIIIIMYFREGFNEPPHFHIRYGEFKAKMNIETLSLLNGSLPPRVLGMVTEWANMHQGELLKNWKRILKGEPLANITPLN